MPQATDSRETIPLVFNLTMRKQKEQLGFSLNIRLNQYYLYLPI